MDSQIFLGGNETETLKDLSAVLGKETIDFFTIQDTKGMQPSVATNYQKTGHDLMSMDELAVMDGGKCILQVRGVRPFFSDKVDITKHEMYKELSDADPKNAFDIAKYVESYGRPKIPKDTQFMELDISGLRVPDDIMDAAIRAANEEYATEEELRQSEE
jgi:type IV secretion system protein VirD4